MAHFITPQEIKQELPNTCPEQIAACRDAVGNILLGNDPRKLLIVGPCSIHNIDAAQEYARRLASLSSEVQDVFYIVMRTYFEKPRTVLGWKGLLYDPFLDGSNNLQEGIRLARKLLLFLAELNLAAATEFLEPLSYSYLGDLISWGSIGARTCQSPIHRQLASNLPMPVGIKNRCDGNIDIAIQACITANQPHNFLGIDASGMVCQIKSPGNNLAHLVLRGSETSPNYDPDSIEDALSCLDKANLLKAVVVDCSHGNSQKNYLKQQQVFQSVISCLRLPIRGIMLESFIQAGAQTHYVSKELGRSITDPCLDWETTERIILQAASSLRQKVISCV